MADNVNQTVVKNCGEAEAVKTAQLLDQSQAEAATQLFFDCYANTEDLPFRGYAMKVNAKEKNGVGTDFSYTLIDRFPRVQTPNGMNVRNLYVDEFHFE